jgi:hypothetical protein
VRFAVALAISPCRSSHRASLRPHRSIRRRDYGRWFALRQGEWFTPLEWMGTGEWLPLRQSEWIAVPDDRIIRVPSPTLEGAHLCYASGLVICFVPPNTGG